MPDQKLVKNESLYTQHLPLPEAIHVIDNIFENSIRANSMQMWRHWECNNESGSKSLEQRIVDLETQRNQALSLISQAYLQGNSQSPEIRIQISVVDKGQTISDISSN